ncbi:MAG: rhodanese-like domain-containing protein [candidate division KSB1 bacterium]|nr:rhodanese-like domain-containing protein [candidate division KSB1 bacterium]
MDRWPPVGQTLQQAAALVALAVVLGLVVNGLHPRGVHLVTKKGPVGAGLDEEPVLRALTDSSFNPTSPLIVNRETMQRLLSIPGTRLLDARAPEDFRRGHLPGAENLPYEEFFKYAAMLAGMSRHTWIVCYCDGPPCDLAEKLAGELFVAGFTRVAVYRGGLKDWRKSGGQIVAAPF